MVYLVQPRLEHPGARSWLYFLRVPLTVGVYACLHGPQHVPVALLALDGIMASAIYDSARLRAIKAVGHVQEPLEVLKAGVTRKVCVGCGVQHETGVYCPEYVPMALLPCLGGVASGLPPRLAPRWPGRRLRRPRWALARAIAVAELALRDIISGLIPLPPAPR